MATRKATRNAVRVGVLLTMLLAAQSPASSSGSVATITPSVTTDDATANGNCTLREAIIAANTDAVRDQCPAGSGSDTIQLQAGTYTLSLGPAGDNAAATGDLDVVNGGLTIVGAGAGATAIDGGGIDRVLHLAASGGAISVTIRDLTIRGGAAGANDGGGILSEGAATLTLSDAVISGNAADEGGGMQTRGIVTIERTTVRGNTAGSDSGAIENFPPPSAILTIRDSLFVDNRAPGSGAIENYATIAITNTTFSQNDAAAVDGGAIRARQDSTTSILNSTIAGNSSATGGGGVRSEGSLTLRNSIVADNTAPVGANCTGTIVSRGGNVVDDGTCSLSQRSDIQADPGLAPLADNGGPTQTHAISSSSPAINRGAACPETDQRGRPRSSPCDSGAFELPTVPETICAGQPATLGTAGNDVLRGTKKADVFAGLAGNDVIKGVGGNDRICGGAGKDKLSGGAGNDKLRGEAGRDKLRGGSGKDRLGGGKSRDTCIGGAQTDRASTCEKTTSLA